MKAAAVAGSLTIALSVGLGSGAANASPGPTLGPPSFKPPAPTTDTYYSRDGDYRVDFAANTAPSFGFSHTGTTANVYERQRCTLPLGVCAAVVQWKPALADRISIVNQYGTLPTPRVVPLSEPTPEYFGKTQHCIGYDTTSLDCTPPLPGVFGATVFGFAVVSLPDGETARLGPVASGYMHPYY